MTSSDTTTLPENLQRLREALPDALNLAQGNSPYAQALINLRDATNFFCDGPMALASPMLPNSGIVVRKWDPRRRCFVSIATSLISVDQLYSLAKTLGKVKVGMGECDFSELGGPAHQDFTNEPENSLATLDSSATLEYAKRTKGELEASVPKEKFASAVTWVTKVREYKLFCDTLRRNLSQNYLIGRVAGDLTVKSEMKQAHHFYGIAGNGREILDQYALMPPEIGRIALESLAADPIKPGQYKGIWSQGASGMLAHEAFGHGKEKNTEYSGCTLAARFVGKRIGSDLVTILDWGGVPGSYGSIAFDDFGVITGKEPSVLVNKGIVTPVFLEDLASYQREKMSGKTGEKLTANGRFQDPTFLPYSRMTNTWFAQVGKGSTLEEMMKMLGEGVILDSAFNGMEDPLNWGVQIKVLRAIEFQNGQLTGRVFPEVGITGYLPDMLNRVVAVGRAKDYGELHFTAGGCGQGHSDIIRVGTGGVLLCMDGGVYLG